MFLLVYFMVPQLTLFVKPTWLRNWLHMKRCIQRATVYSDVLDMYMKNLEEIQSEYPFCIQFINECAIDTGVCVETCIPAFGSMNILNFLMETSCWYQLYIPIANLCVPNFGHHASALVLPAISYLYGWHSPLLQLSYAV